MSEHREEHIDLCAGYALGSLDPEDRRRLDEHLALGCEACEAALADFSATTVLLAASAPAARPPHGLRARVLSIVESTPQDQPAPATKTEAPPSVTPIPQSRVIELKPRPRPAPWSFWVPALAAAALAVTSAMYWNEARNLRAELATRRGEIVDLTARLAEEERLNEVLSAPGAKVAVLSITPQGEETLRARATYDPRSREAVLVFDNFKPPSGHDYQLWALHGATPANLGVISTDETGHAVVRLQDAGDPATLAAFAVSLEPAGGSPNPAAPSGPVVMLGKLGG